MIDAAKALYRSKRCIHCGQHILYCEVKGVGRRGWVSVNKEKGLFTFSCPQNGNGSHEDHSPFVFVHPKSEVLVKLNDLTTKGVVYLISSGELYKIGQTAHLEERIKSLAAASAYPISVEYIINCDNPKWLEKKLHKRYASQRDHGEWFRLTPQQATEVKAITSDEDLKEEN